LIKIERLHGLNLLLEGFVKTVLYGGDPELTAEGARQALELTDAIVFSTVRAKTVDRPWIGMSMIICL
jgi:hypothetical protein